MSARVRALLLQYFGQSLLLCPIYFASALLALQLTRFNGGVAIVWPAGAVLFSALAAMPHRRWAMALLLCFPAGALAIALRGFGGAYTLPLTLAGLFEAWLAASLLRHLSPRFTRFESIRDVVSFLLVAGVIAPAASAFIGAWAAHGATGIPFFNAWRDWFGAHALSLVTFAPPIFLVLRRRRLDPAKFRRERLGEALVLMGAVSLATLATFGQNRIPLVVVPLVPMVAATFRLGRIGAVASLLVLICGGLIGTMTGHGPTMLLHLDMPTKLLVLQIYFACVVLILLPVAAELESRRRLMQNLRDAEALHRLIVERTGDVIMRVNLDGTLRSVSEEGARLWGYQAEELLGRSAYDLVHPEDEQAVFDARFQALCEPEGTVAVECRVMRKDGGSTWVESHMCATLDPRGVPNGTVSIIRDNSARRRLIENLAHEANTDPLTGLGNRRAFDRAMARDRKAGGSGCLALFDLDHFKRINDVYGHATGDRILTMFATLLCGTVRAGDVVARLGGEEFGVLLRDVSLEQAGLICERVRTRLAESEGRSILGEVVRVTVSVGLTPLNADMPPEEAFRQADAALYRAKGAGRNQMAIAA